MAGNGSGSYQNADGKGTYESIPIEGQGEAPTNGSGKKKKMLIGALVIAVLAAVGYSLSQKAPGVAQDAAVAAAQLPKSKTGKLKLFDGSGEFIARESKDSV
jgi:hypothetical protein